MIKQDQTGLQWTITILEVKGIQEYLFRSNELRENIGASHIVQQVTEHELQQELESRFPDAHNLGAERKSKQMEKPNDRLQVELLYAGGGNTVLLFRDEEAAKAFTYAFSRKVLLNYPGLQLLAVHHPFSWETDNLATKLDEARLALVGVRARVGAPAPLLGLGVTAVCNSTQFPANFAHPNKKAGDNFWGVKPVVSAETYAKQEASKKAGERLTGLTDIADDYEWTTELNDLAANPHKTREESYIAVVHVDGNGMGLRFQALAKHFKENKKTASGANNRAYIEAMRQLSHKVDEVATNALCRTLDHVRQWLAANEPQTTIFPVRPLVFGGDDVTLVCRGDLGLGLAQRLIAEMAEERLPSLDTLTGQAADPKQQEGEPLYACAGVAIVKTHYPFARAYALSEELCQEAKAQVKALVGQSKQASAIDWHISSTGLQGDLAEIRQREYRIQVGEECYQLEARPLLCSPTDKTWRTWSHFERLVTEFGLTWVGQRNKVMALREAVRGGPTAVEQFASARPSHGLPQLGIGENGFALDNRCLFYDAIEAMDQFVSLTLNPQITEMEATA